MPGLDQKGLCFFQIQLDVLDGIEVPLPSLRVALISGLTMTERSSLNVGLAIDGLGNGSTNPGVTEIRRFHIDREEAKAGNRRGG